MICNIQNPLSYQYILSLFIYAYLYVTIFKLVIFWLAKYWGGGFDHSAPCSYGHDMIISVCVNLIATFYFAFNALKSAY